MLRTMASPSFEWATHDPSRLYLPDLAPLGAIPRPRRNTSLTPPSVEKVGRSREPMVLVASRSTSAPKVIDINAYYRVAVPYSQPRSKARAGVVWRLHRAARNLPAGFGIAVFGAHRSLAAQQARYDAAVAAGVDGYVAAPSIGPLDPSPHLTGGALDVTLTYQGLALALGTGLDEFTDAAHLRAFERGGLDASDTRIRDLRRLLFWSMQAQGFVAHRQMWWHFEHGTTAWAAETGRPVRYGVVEMRFVDTDRPGRAAA